jgi:hypothetical protein
MASQENRLNDALRHLGEEFRLGMVSPEEYRARRRLLLESWGERDVTTSPSSLKRGTGTTAPNPAPLHSFATPAGTKAAPAARAPLGWMLGMVLLLALALAGGAYWLQTPPRPAPAGAAQIAITKPPPARSAGVIALAQSATEFLDRNRWEAADLDAFSQQWRALPAAERHAARHEPAIRSLRHELEQNIRAETLALSANAQPDAEQQGRLNGLLQFARELDGTM